MARKNATQMWPLSKLKDHPKQAEFFGDLSEAETKALAKDMDKNGQRTPIDVLPDGTIIGGHQRVRVARQLKWKQIEVKVHHDLAAAGPHAVEELFLADNLHRRHLSPLTRARCISRLIEIEMERNPKKQWRGCHEQVKAEIAAQLKMSLRTVNRYLLILEAPPAVQSAFDRGEIKLTDAGRVALLDKRTQAEIARRIAAGEVPKAVVAAYLPKSDGRHRNVGDAVASADRAFVKILDDLEGRVDEVRPGHVKRRVDVLTRVLNLTSWLREVAGVDAPRRGA